jgi:hypothetical protein
VAAGATRQVGPGQSYATIQSCLNAAAAGDICNVHAGTYSEQLSFPVSGKAGAPIILQNNPGDIVNVQTTSSPVVSIGGHDYITVQGDQAANFIFTYNGSGTGPVVFNNAVGTNVDGLTIQRVTANLTGGTGSGVVLYIADCDSCLITGNVLHNASAAGSMDGADLLYSSNLIFSDNVVYGNSCSTATSLEDGLVVSGTNLTIVGNTLHDGCSYDNHPDGIVVQGDGDRFGNQTSDVTVAQNTVYNFTQGLYFDDIHNPETNLKIYDNVVYEQSSYRYGGNSKQMNCLVIDGEGLSGSATYYHTGYVENNTFACLQLHLYVLRTVAGESVTFQNNVFVAPPFTGLTLSSTTGLTLDYNYYSNGDATPIRWGAVNYSLSAFKSATSQEAHSTSGSAGLNADYSESASSDTRNRGANFSSNFAIDIVGTPRPSSGSWDTGAYQFVNSTNMPAPPTNLTAHPH